MKIKFVPLILLVIVILFISTIIYSQFYSIPTEQKLENNITTPEENITKSNITLNISKEYKPFYERASKGVDLLVEEKVDNLTIENKSTERIKVYIQFWNIPNSTERDILSQSKVNLLNLRYTEKLI